ncbi:hypothetical protein NLJ89_g7603 [Agrocybe chaxingu]|uniref:Laccase n=1 Tax=Agrocybe chaxingu TaxID=84603 RepID=A0A9W8JWH5_9AGAR|nr:hypothetical protein NLJ89_g7603 [Agrocybe chaxingu]
MLRSTSVHWHGIFQRGSAWADGAAAITQCPISPNNSFSYEFSAPKQAGTFWYHSHFGTQYCDGLRGPLVVYDPKDPHRLLYDVDDESTIITLSDWYHFPAPSLIPRVIAESTLINGKGRYGGGPKVDLAVVDVQKGRRYRFRLLSLSCEPNYIFSIGGHKLKIIEADGENVLPVIVDSLQIFAGQRYSFVLTANRPVDNYWIRSLPDSGKHGLDQGFEGGLNSAILRYRGAPRVEPSQTKFYPPSKPIFLKETDLHPLLPTRVPGRPFAGGADINFNLALGFDPEKFSYTVNGAYYADPPIPVLLQIMSGARSPQELLPQGAVVTLPKNKVVEISIPGGIIGGAHPFHLHGVWKHSFYVVKSAGNHTRHNYVNPVIRDVTSIGEAGSNTTIRFVTDNPGPWVFHCHIDFHVKMGMAIVFVVDPEKASSSYVPAAWDTLCPSYNDLAPSATSVKIVPTSD